MPVGGTARVLITSNRESDLGPNVPVDVFTEEEALTFLAVRTGLADDVAAATLAAELRYLPLALAQAAAVIATQHLGYQTYLDQLRALPVGDYLTSEQPYSHGVAESVLLSLDTVRAGDQAGVGAGVMQIMAVLSGAGVRRDLLHAAGQGGRAGQRRTPGRCGCGGPGLGPAGRLVPADFQPGRPDHHRAPRGVAGGPGGAGSQTSADGSVPTGRLAA